MNGLQKMLAELGLSFRESSVYSYLLRSGEISASVVARELSIKRSSAYTLLESLHKRGLVTQTSRNRIQVYTAIDPKLYLEKYKREQTNALARLNKISKQLEESSPLDSFFYQKPKVYFHSGEEGIKQIMRDLIQEKQTLHALVTDRFLEFLNLHVPDFIQKRAQQGIEALVAYPFPPHHCPGEKFNRQFLRHSKHVAQQFDRGMNFVVYGKKTALIFLKEKFGLIVDSANMAESFRQYFEEIWLSDQSISSQ